MCCLRSQIPCIIVAWNYFSRIHMPTSMINNDTIVTINIHDLFRPISSSIVVIGYSSFKRHFIGIDTQIRFRCVICFLLRIILLTATLIMTQHLACSDIICVEIGNLNVIGGFGLRKPFNSNFFDYTTRTVRKQAARSITNLLTVIILRRKNYQKNF